jgi:hypothetical protein
MSSNLNNYSTICCQNGKGTMVMRQINLDDMVNNLTFQYDHVMLLFHKMPLDLGNIFHFTPFCSLIILAPMFLP